MKTYILSLLFFILGIGLFDGCMLGGAIVWRPRSSARPSPSYG